MLHLVRANSPYTVIILAILTLVLKLQALEHAVLPVADAHHALFGIIVSLSRSVIGNSAAAFTWLAVAIIFGQALYLMSITRRHRLFTKHNYIPAFAYIVLSALHPALGQFSVPLMLNWLLLGALDTALHFSKRDQPPRTIFNAGFLLACAALLHFPAIIFFLFFVLALLWLRTFKTAEWVVGALGYFTPFYFTAGLLYLFDRWRLISAWPQWGNGLPLKDSSLYIVVLVCGCLVLLVFGVIVLVRTFFRMPVSVRRSWGAIGTAMAVSVALCCLTPRTESATWLCVLPPMSLLVIPPMFGEKRGAEPFGNAQGRHSRSFGFATFVFYFLLLLVFSCQLILRR